MKTRFLLIGLICCSLSCLSQSKIVGRVKGEQEYLPLVNVVLWQDSVAFKATSTDSLGNFVFEKVPAGTYGLSASMIGYKMYDIVLDIEGLDLTLADIILAEYSFTLKAVEVRGEKQWLDHQPDRTIINLNGSVTSAGNTVLEVLQKSPGVVVNRQSNTIAVNGKSGVKIMLNEKILQVPPEVAIQMLDGMSASNVNRIELVLTPTANYDADGNGGFIHIVTKTQVDYGTAGSFGFTLGAHWAETLGGTVALNHRNKKAAYFFDYSIIRNHNFHKVSMHRRAFAGDDLYFVLDSSRRENLTTQQNFNAGAEWNLNDNTLLKILISGYKRNWNMHANAVHHSIYPDSGFNTSMNVTESNIWQSATGSVGLQRKINSRNNLEVAFDYLFYYNQNPSGYDAPGEADDIALSKKTPIHILIGKADYQSTITSSLSWETGVKTVRSVLNNDVHVNRMLNGIWQSDPTFSSSSQLHEYVLSGYFSADWRIEKWQINTGLRYEYTRTSITSEGEKNLVQRRYGYPFPNFSLKKKFPAGSEFYLSYNRRLTRPTYNDMAPFVFFWGPNSFSSGNTSLYPALSDGVTLGYNLKPWAISLQYTHSQKEIAAMQPAIDDKTNLIMRSQNLKYLNTFAFTTSYSASITSWWEVQGTIVAQYQSGRSLHYMNTAFARYGLNLNLMNVLRLPKDFSIEISYMYQSRALSGISYFLPIASLNAGIQKKFGQSALKLAVDDILYTNAWKIKTYSPVNNLDVYFHYDWYNQFARLTYTWNFGNTKLKSVKLKSGSEEERQRVSN